MGQKVNPNGLRLGVNKDWDVKWFANGTDYPRFLNNDIKIREYFDKIRKISGISKVQIERNSKRCEVIIYTSKPGIIIGRGGEAVEKMKKDLSELTGEALQVSITDVKKPDMDAQIVADSNATQIQNRASFRMAQKRAIRNAMKAGAKGVKTLASGRLGGADMARSEGYTEGTIPLHTIRADVDYATSEADTTFGKVGIKVWIYKGEVLPSTEIKGGN
jgi:small subunit ribosomal protein S3